MAMYVYWFLLALILVGTEMSTGTFYMLVVAVAMAIGGVAALLGFAFEAQLALAALAGILGIVLLRRWKVGHAGSVTNQSLDIGEPVKMVTLHGDGTARVLYRGAQWNAELDDKNSAHEGVFYIKDIRGSVLILTDKKIV